MTREEAIEVLRANYPDACYSQLREAVDVAIEALSADPCEDAISRAEAIRIASGYCHWTNIPDELAKLPPVTPKPKTGYWTYICNSRVNGLKIVECSECGKRTYGSGKHCPNCGAKMIGTQESGDEECRL